MSISQGSFISPDVLGYLRPEPPWVDADRGAHHRMRALLQ
jgi:hypothetical protein